MWQTPAWGFWSKKKPLIFVSSESKANLRAQYLECIALSYDKSWNTLCLNIISKLFGIITRQWNCSFLCRNRLSAWTMISDLALRTWGEHLKVEMVWKIKITAHRQRIRLSVVGNTMWVKTFPLWPFLVVLHYNITVDNLLTERTKASWRQWHWTN